MKRFLSKFNTFPVWKFVVCTMGLLLGSVAINHKELVLEPLDRAWGWFLVIACGFLLWDIFYRFWKGKKV